MTIQIAVRLPDELVQFIDEQVSSGHAASRAAVVSVAVERERRRELAARDARILATHAGEPDDLIDLAAYARATSLPLDG